MDPLSQGVIGATLPQSFLKSKSHAWAACLLGFLSGMAPDLDILIRSDEDPLIYLEFHRQFTHSLIFIPIGGLICAFVLHKLFFKKKISFKTAYLYSTLGYATHGLLDACTSYGTQLLWPFSNTRISWNNVSIVDPLFTIPLLVMMLLALWKKSRVISRFALAYGVSYLVFGLYQGYRAEKIGYSVTDIPRANIKSLSAKPTFANLFLWKVIYESETHFYTTAVNLFFPDKKYSTKSVQKLDVARDFPDLDLKSVQADDIERFRWFSMGYIAKNPGMDNGIIDVRYSTIPNRLDPMWGIELDFKQSENHVKFRTYRKDMKNRMGEFFELLFNSSNNTQE